MSSMSIIGCGKVGKSLGKLLKDRSDIRIKQILNKTIASSLSSIEFIGEGEAARSGDDLLPVDLLMLTTSDDEIKNALDVALKSKCVGEGTIVFHCSGSQPSSILELVKSRGALIASVHPIMSFADPFISCEKFVGTYCGCEGDSEALKILEVIFEKCGAKTFRIDSEQKLIYHAGTVFVCNYLTALIEIGLRCYEKAGIDRNSAMTIMQPIIEGTIANNYKLGPIDALTGPIARGDASLARRQFEEILRWDGDLAKVYASLASITVQISRHQGNADEEQLSSILRALT